MNPGHDSEKESQKGPVARLMRSRPRPSAREKQHNRSAHKIGAAHDPPLHFARRGRVRDEQSQQPGHRACLPEPHARDEGVKGDDREEHQIDVVRPCGLMNRAQGPVPARMRILGGLRTQHQDLRPRTVRQGLAHMSQSIVHGQEPRAEDAHRDQDDEQPGRERREAKGTHSGDLSAREEQARPRAPPVSGE